MVKITVQSAVIMKPGDRWFTDHNKTIHKSALLRLVKASSQRLQPPQSFPRVGSETLEGAHSRSWACPEHCIFSGKIHIARAPRPELVEKLKAPPRKQNKDFGRATFTSNSVEQSPGWPWVLSTNRSVRSSLREAATPPHDKQKTKHPTRKH